VAARGVGKDRRMRRSLLVITAIGVTGAVAAPGAAAAPRCAAPHALTWHSCLNAAHRAVLDTPDVRLTRATAVLVQRVSACPEDVASRRVAIRTQDGRRIARRRVAGTCAHSVARWRLTVRPNTDFRSGTVIRSFWSGIADDDRAPSVKLGKKKTS
jgi:hypothetical protein